MTVYEIIAVALTALGLCAFIYLLPQIKALIPQIKKWVETHTTAEQRKVLVELAGQIVRAAEQLFGSKTGEQKLAYAMEMLEKLMPYIDADVRRAAIEDQVYALKAE